MPVNSQSVPPCSW